MDQAVRAGDAQLALRSAWTPEAAHELNDPSVERAGELIADRVEIRLWSLVGDPVGTIMGTVEPFAYVATHLIRPKSNVYRKAVPRSAL